MFNKNVTKWSFQCLIAFAVLAILISSFYHRSLVLSPVSVWDGLRIGFHSVLWDSNAHAPIDIKSVISLNQKLTEDRNNGSLSNTVEVSNVIQKDLQVRRQLSSNQERITKTNNQIARIENLNQRLLDTQSMLGSLNQNYTDSINRNQIEAARRAQINASLERQEEVRKSADIQSLVSKRGQNTSKPAISEKVLENIQNSTGISPEEITELMNK